MTDRLTAAVAELVEALRAELNAERPDPDEADRLLSIEDAAAAAGIGRSLLYDQIAAGRVRSCKVGRRRLVPASAIRELAADADRRRS